MLSIVIPVFNEAESLEALHRELGEVAAAEGYDLDVVFVDDGSSDGSWEVIRRLAAADPRVRGIRFRRNFGKAAALSAGFAQARGELVMTLDADLQDDPHEIPRFLAEMEKQLDVVSGWKKVRHDPWHKVLALAGVQLDGQLPDRRGAARPQLRHEVLPPRDLRRGAALRRAAPLRAGAGGRPGIPRRRAGHQPPPAPVRPLEVRRDAASSRASSTC